MEAPDISKLLRKFLARIPGAQSIAVTDREGAIIFKAALPGVIEHPGNEALTLQFTATAEQAGKMNFGRSKHVTSFFSDRVVVQLNYAPLVVAVVGTPDLNVGALLTLSSELKKALEPLGKSVERQLEQS